MQNVFRGIRKFFSEADYQYRLNREFLALMLGPVSGNFLPMTIVHMSEKGQIVVPKEAREKHGFGHGSAFAFLESKSGSLIFRPVNAKPKLSLVQHLRKFKGVEIPQRRHHCPPRV